MVMNRETACGQTDGSVINYCRHFVSKKRAVKRMRRDAYRIRRIAVRRLAMEAMISQDTFP